MDIRPLFLDFDEKDPTRGATTRAVEHILQHYLESEDYAKKVQSKSALAKKWFEYLSEKDKEMIKFMLENP